MLSIDKTVGTSATLTSTATMNGTLAVNTGTFAISNVTFTQNGATTVADTLNITSTTGTKTFVGSVDVTSGGTWNDSASEDVTLEGGLTFDGAAFTAGTGTYTFSTNNQTLGGGSAIQIPNVKVTGVNLTNSNSGGLTASTTLSGTGKLVQAANVVLNIGGTVTINNMSATSTGNTVNYTGGAQTVFPCAYTNLTLEGPGAGNNKTLTSVTSVTGNLVLSGTASTTDAAALAVGGGVTVNTGTSFTLAGFNFSASSTVEVAGTMAISSNVGTKTFGGQLLIDSGGIWNRFRQRRRDAGERHHGRRHLHRRHRQLHFQYQQPGHRRRRGRSRSPM